MTQQSYSLGVDDLMERASQALVATDYFDAEALALKAMSKAKAAGDYERMARIAMPLQEARRQRRHAAVDSGHVLVMRDLSLRRELREPGCYLIEPPLVGIEARAVRELLNRRKAPALVLAREPLTKAGTWPIVAVGTGQFQPVVARAYVPPAEGVPAPAWFLAAQEAVGDAAIAKVKSDLPADHRADELWDYLEGVPDHEKLSQAFQAACREAALMPQRSAPRRPDDNPFSF